MNERFNNPEEVNAFLDSGEFVDGLRRYLVSFLEEHQAEILPVLESVDIQNSGPSIA